MRFNSGMFRPVGVIVFAVALLMLMVEVCVDISEPQFNPDNTIGITMVV